MERWLAAGLAPQARRRHAAVFRHRLWRRLATVGGVAAAATLVLPATVGSAAVSRPQPTLAGLVAQAKSLGHQIDVMSQQYDGLRIQLTEARAEAKTAMTTYRQDATRLVSGQAAIGQLAAESYMNGGLATPLQVLTSPNTGSMLSRAAIMQQLQTENGDRVSALSTAEAAARRAHDTAVQQETKVTTLAKVMSAKKQAIQGKVNTLNSAAFAQAMSIYQRTGNYPNVNLPTANTVGAQALQYAMTRRGDPYVWGAAGPGTFDCSGLVMWAYAQVGISLPHYTVSQWNMGQHISRSQLQPGDLVFFYAGIDHVGIYLGNGLMVDAPSSGQLVQVQPVMWDVYVGAVRIV
ncbi:MAG: peptidoglycan DL-endopeptidase CwlO [Streptosporangiaceae bacterium]|nr:peptidoglycan DL-endopeptidase CwlO [Streptosporangiaceae bacterium]